MRKVLIIITICVAIASLLGATAVMAAPAGKDTPARNNPNNLYLYPKVDVGATEWAIQWEEEDWGKFNFKIDGGNISGVFNGHGLVAGTEYALISYNDPEGDPWLTQHSVEIIGVGTANANGNVHILVKDPVDLGPDVASPIYDGSCEGDGYKIWLVPKGDLNAAGTAFAVWDGDEYLFENNRIGCTTCTCP